MSGDYSRIRFDPYLDISGVLMQQGRVQLDSDWNEWAAAMDRRMRTENIDTFGVCTPPGSTVAVVSPQTPDAFKVEATAGKITLGRGRMYVDGLLAENHGYIENGEEFDPVLVELRGTDPLPYDKQPYLPNPPALPGSATDKYIGSGGPYLAYLEVWQREATYHQLPGILENAVDADTTTRLQTVWQVRLLENIGAADCGTPDNEIEDWQKITRPSAGRLSVKTVEAIDDKGPCELPLGGGYRGLENQLYRIEIHDGGGMGEATFKWSRENASVESNVVEIDATYTKLKLSSMGRDTVLRFNEGDWVEVTDDWRELGGEDGKPQKRRGEMCKIIDLSDNELTIILASPLSLEMIPDGGDDTLFTRHTRVIRWEQKDGDTVLLFKENGDKIEPSAAVENGLIKVPADKGVWMALENGIQIQFDLDLDADAVGGEFRCGDYWVSAARTANTSVEKLAKAPPRGIHRHYTRLSIVNFPGFETDCRVLWPPFFGGCCTYTVGDGIKSRGHFKSIQAAVDALPPEGGKVCVLPGIHTANVQLHAQHNSNIHITGCGLQTLIFPEDGRDGEAIFHIEGGTGIQLSDLTLVTANGVAIEVINSYEINIKDNAIIACTHAINFNCVSNDSFPLAHKDTAKAIGLPLATKRESATNAVRITGNKIAMLNKSTGGAAIFTAADDILIEDNLIIVVPSPRKNGEVEQNQIEVHSLLVYAETVREERLLLDVGEGYLAGGGIQIAGGSEFVTIRRNRIVGGGGNGVTLGSITSQGNQKYPLFIDGLNHDQLHDIEPYTIPLVYDIKIEDNSISVMGLAGIGLPSIFKFGVIDFTLTIDDLGIHRNRIENCLLQLPEDIPDWAGMGGIVLMACENAQIQGNKIENNGAGQPKAVCGILIFYGEKIDISGNRILNNGPQTIASRNLEEDTSQPGVRGGIVILSGLARAFNIIYPDVYPAHVYSDGIPAIKIHDNIITQPLGQALVMTALGPVSVTGNHLTSQGVDFKANPSSALAASVFILNLGVSKDLKIMMEIASALLASFFEVARIHKTTVYPRAVGQQAYDYPWLKYSYFPSGNIMFANNQVLLDLRNLEPSFSFSSQLIASLDDVAYSNNQSECASIYNSLSTENDFLFTDAAIVSITQRCSDNRFQEGFTSTILSLFSLGFMNLAIGNQATNCLLVIGGDDANTATTNNVLLPTRCYDYQIGITGSLGQKAK